MLLIPLRVYLLPSLFTPSELAVLDAPVASADAVLVSLGGPLQPERNQRAEAVRDEEVASGRSTANGGGREEEGLRKREKRETEEGEVEGGEAGLQRVTSIKR